jgi:hypothetical protein
MALRRGSTSTLSLRKWWPGDPESLKGAPAAFAIHAAHVMRRLPRLRRAGMLCDGAGQREANRLFDQIVALLAVLIAAAWTENANAEILSVTSGGSGGTTPLLSIVSYFNTDDGVIYNADFTAIAPIDITFKVAAGPSATYSASPGETPSQTTPVLRSSDLTSNS